MANEYKEYISKGDKLFEQGKYEKAAEAYKRGKASQTKLLPIVNKALEEGKKEEAAKVYQLGGGLNKAIKIYEGKGDKESLEDVYIDAVRDVDLGHVQSKRENALKTLERFGSNMNYEKAINLDYCDYKGVPREERFNLKEKVDDVEVKFNGFYNKGDNVAEGKFVVGKDDKGKNVSVFDNTFAEHKDIAYKYGIREDGVEGGGKIIYDPNSKKIEAYDKSDNFGLENREKTKELLSKSMGDDYEIIAKNPK